MLDRTKKDCADALRLAGPIFSEELCKHGLHDEVSQAFAVFLPV